ncbi:MAG: YdcF family protein [Oscillospiraceae bacterium]|nr:YdcF family protein [Oscillospiraceae bacterium]
MKDLKVKQIIKKILYATGILLLINIVFLIFVANFHIGFVFLAVISIAIILYGYYFDEISKFLHIVIAIICVILLGIMTFLAIYGNLDVVQYDEDVIIVLGAGLIGEDVSRTLANRLDSAIEYHRQNPYAFIVVTGGLGDQTTITEAEAMKRYLIDRGVPREKIIKEDSSRNTFQNLSFANDILIEYFPEGFTSVIITNDFHAYRAVRFSREIGMDSKHIGARTPIYTVPLNFVRETVAVLRIWIMP